MQQASPIENDQVGELIERMLHSQEQVLEQLRKVIVGQDDVVEQVLISLYVSGNSIITGFPGLAKTLLISSISETLGLSFSRIQFTPDLMPADITGTEIIEEDRSTGKRHLEFVPGPIFANLVLADEINRTPPKTQAALLEAMQERRVTVGRKTFQLEAPFTVMATQNPIELEGTYPLPEAQLDRFMFNILIGYLEEDEEIAVVNQTTGSASATIEAVVTSAELLRYQALVRQIPASEDVTRYAVRLSRASRPGDPLAPDFINEWVSYGASLRAAQFMILGGRARALLRGRFNVAVEDVRALARPVLRHRILSNFQAESEKITTDDIIGRLLEKVTPPQSGL
ncbi:MAG: AAA family ATPase [Acidobacteriota bacterium]